jgi:hypothetical protein
MKDLLKTAGDVQPSLSRSAPTRIYIRRIWRMLAKSCPGILDQDQSACALLCHPWRCAWDCHDQH